MISKLGEVCRFYSGTGFPVIYQGKDTGELPFYKVSDIAANVAAGNIKLTECKNYVSSEEATEMKGTVIPKDTIVFAKIGEALKLNRRAITGCDCLIDNNAMGIAPRPEHLRVGYFYYYMKNLRMQDYAESTTVPSVRKSKLEMVPITVPPLDTQKQIETILDKVYAVLRLRQQELNSFDELIKARFVELFGTIRNNVYNYDIKTIQDVCEQIKDGTHQTPRYTEDTINGFKFLSSKDVTTGKIDWTKIKYIPEDLHNELYSRIAPKKGDLLLAKNGTTGVAAIVDVDEVFDIYVSLALLRPIDVDSVYLWGAVNSAETKEQFDSSLKGIGVPNLHLGEIKKTKIIVPPKDKQLEFAAFVEQVDKSKLS